MTQHWRATVREVTGEVRHYYGTLIEDVPVQTEKIPPPAWVEIVADGEGFFLFYFNAAGNVLTDTWHASLPQAKAQAAREFRIADADWVPVNDSQ